MKSFSSHPFIMQTIYSTCCSVVSLSIKTSFFLDLIIRVAKYLNSS